jgi:hypothetical protein
VSKAIRKATYSRKKVYYFVSLFRHKNPPFVFLKEGAERIEKEQGLARPTPDNNHSVHALVVKSANIQNLV